MQFLFIKSGEFPWTVAILKEEKALDGQVLNVYVCGGSLIDAGKESYYIFKKLSD